MGNPHVWAGRPARIVRLLAASGLALAAGACDILDKPAPEIARVVIEGDAGLRLELITTTDFDVVRTEDGEMRELYIFSADTADVVSPYDRTYRLVPRTRFYMVVNCDSTPSESVTVRVFIDEEERYRRVTNFGDDVVEFVYSFKE